jgi:hypothetical protein
MRYNPVMLPFYFLTIFFNAVTGYILAFRKAEDGEEDGFSFGFDNGMLRLVIGGASMLTGLFKLLSPVSGNVPVLGDLVPALANLAGGFILVFEYYRSRSSVASETADRIEKIAVRNRKAAGFFSIGAALLHFIFYPVLFL